MGRRTPFSLRGWEFDHAPVSIWATQAVLAFSFLRVEWECKDGRVDLGGLGSKCVQGALY